MKRKMLVCLLALCMIFPIVPVTAYATESTDDTTINVEQNVDEETDSASTEASGMQVTSLDEGQTTSTSEGEEESWYNADATEFIIDSVEDLLAFREVANTGVNFAGKVIKLGADIDLDGATWIPIASFGGEFDGNGYTIKNFHIEAIDSRGGFFNVIEAGSGERVHDLTLSDVTATVGNNRFGTLANSIQGIVNRITIKNVTVTTTHTGAWVGGMAAFFSWPWVNDCTVENLTVNAEAGADIIAGITPILQKNSNMVFDNLDVNGMKVIVADTDSSGCGVAGFVGQTQRGWEYPEVKNCDVTGLDITASGLVDTAGFIAWPGAHTTATNCTTQGTIDATGVTSSDCFAGGFFGNLGWNCDLGQMGHVITDCTADVDIKTSVAPAGGFVGSATNSNNNSMYATFNNCVAKGDIISTGAAPVGGFAGNADRGTYNNCSATGEVTGADGTTGGFIGYILDTTPKYDSRYPAGTREYLADYITIADCTAKELPLIGGSEGSKPEEEVNVSDEKPPIVEVGYSATEPTNNDVTVTLQVTEAVTVENEDWVLNEKTGYYEKTYTVNTEETVVVMDLAGNKTEVKVSVQNIVAPEAPGTGGSTDSDSKDEKNDESGVPDTGDYANVMGCLVAMTIALSATVCILFKKRNA